MAKVKVVQVEKDPTEAPEQLSFDFMDLYTRLNGRLSTLSFLLNDNAKAYPCDLDGAFALGALFTSMARDFGMTEQEVVHVAQGFYRHTTPKPEAK